MWLLLKIWWRYWRKPFWIHWYIHRKKPSLILRSPFVVRKMRTTLVRAGQQWGNLCHVRGESRYMISPYAQKAMSANWWKVSYYKNWYRRIRYQVVTWAWSKFKFLKIFLRYIHRWARRSLWSEIVVYLCQNYSWKCVIHIGGYLRIWVTHTTCKMGGSF